MLRLKQKNYETGKINYYTAWSWTSMVEESLGYIHTSLNFNLFVANTYMWFHHVKQHHCHNSIQWNIPECAYLLCRRHTEKNSQILLSWWKWGTKSSREKKNFFFYRYNSTTSIISFHVRKRNLHLKKLILSINQTRSKYLNKY